MTDSREVSFEDGFLPLDQEIRRSYFDEFGREGLELNEEDINLLESYLRKMLVVDPERRVTSKDLLSDPWVSLPSPLAEEAGRSDSK